MVLTIASEFDLDWQLTTDIIIELKVHHTYSTKNKIVW